MKKIDLHIHTVASINDSDFNFSLDILKKYVETLKIDFIAITNHNLFDLEQFNIISKALKIAVFPGIEIDLEKGHLLLIADNNEIEDFENRCNQIKRETVDSYNDLSIKKLKEIFVDLRKYLIIPHYDKDPIIKPEIITELKDFISAGEVSSPKKFIYCINNPNSLVPVLFSDLRCSEDISEFPPRQTFIETDDNSFRSLRTCLLDKNKVHLSEKPGRKFFQVFEDGQIISTGLNVILGERSTGKTYTLKRISNLFSNIKYIKQFELLETDEEKDIDKFNRLLSAKQSSVSETYLSDFKFVVDDIINIDKKHNEKEIENYIDSLLKVAAEEEKKDVFSQATLFNESKYTETDNVTLKKLIGSIELLIENKEYREIIESHIPQDTLKRLIIDLFKKFNEVEEMNRKKLWLNSIITNTKKELQSFTASISIEEIDFYRVLIEKEKLKKFISIAELIKSERIIEKKDIRRFQIIASTQKFGGAQELLNKCGKKAKFSDAFNQYEYPVEYLDELKDIQILEPTDYYKYFVDVEYKILNEHGIEVSGGERSEFNLLEKIQDAYQYDMLLIDEPESSFDNLFLRNEVNEQIRDISKSIPVIIVTHNNTVGASIKPDFILYTKKEIIDKKPFFKIYSGNPSDQILKSTDGEVISNYQIMLNCLEAGDQAYKERWKTYEILKD